jgi:probable F420-dependent oxidoreductase
MRPFRFGLQLRADDLGTVGTTAAGAEALGFDIVLVADHVGSDWSPLLTLAAAAAATTRVRLGTFVLNCCLHHPLMLAREIATLDHLSGGRMEVGLGAGHTPAEFAAAGIPLEPPAVRKGRLAAFTEVLRALLDGETVDRADEFFSLHGAAIRPALQPRLPLLVGGSGTGLLAHAAQHADIVGFTGLGRTLPDGHRHRAHMEPERLDVQVLVVGDAAGARDVELNILVQVVDVTTDRRVVAERLAAEVEGLTVADALATPFLAFGTHDEIAAQLTAARDRWGLSYFVVRDAEAFAPVIARLR